MNSKTIILTSNGLKNLVPNMNNDEMEFRFVFGEHEIKMKSIFAEFISPLVSNLHHADPTTNSFQFNENSNIVLDEKIITDEILFLFKQISSGYPIKINEEQSIQLRLISNIIGNDELYEKINEAYPFDINDSNINHYIENLDSLLYLSEHSNQFKYSDIIDFISRHFYSIDKSKLLQLPKPLLYSIISNKNLLILNEDSLLDFINAIFTKDDKDSGIDIISFYECVNFLNLSEAKFRDFLSYFDINQVTNEIWQKFIQCFYINVNQTKYRKKERYSTACRPFLYDGNVENSFEGIINYLTVECKGNVHEKGIVNVTSSSVYGERIPKYAVDFNDINHFFQSRDDLNSWLKYEFIDSSIHPTHYSIRTRNEGKTYFHPKNWVIEASNSDRDDDWKILDSRNDITCLDDASVVHTFEIQNKLDENEYFRFIRIRQTGVETNGSYYLTLSSLEYFGLIIV